jgi:hypothetical protein
MSLEHRPTRRDLLKGIVAVETAALFARSAVSGETASVAPPIGAGPSALIPRENSRQGTRDWLLANTRIDPKTKYRCPWIEGYCSKTSARAGEEISFFVSTDPASSFTLDLYRMGYYAGAGGRLIQSLGAFAGKTQETPPIGERRLRDCQWEPCATTADCRPEGG